MDVIQIFVFLYLKLSSFWYISTLDDEIHIGMEDILDFILLLICQKHMNVVVF